MQHSSDQPKDSPQRQDIVTDGIDEPRTNILSFAQAEDILRCTICRDFFDAPSELVCGHHFCLACINDARISHCPICRGEKTCAKGNRILRTTGSVVQHLEVVQIRCLCGMALTGLSAYRAHIEVCHDVKRANKKAVENVTNTFPQMSSRAEPVATVNRSTFKCPLCGDSNLSLEGLVQHIDTVHQGRRQAAKCPICNSMPWADHSYVCPDIRGHMLTRHQMNYSEFVDFNAYSDQGEEAMLQQVLAASLGDF